MKPLHQELKDIRVEKGVTLEEIYRETKIRVPFLEKIEEGDFSVVPEPFMRAFLREYAETVGIDPDRVISKYEGKSTAIRDDDSGIKKNEQPEVSARSGAGTSASIPPLVNTAVIPREISPAAPVEQPAPEVQTAAKIISDEPASSRDPETLSSGPGGIAPAYEDSKSPRALFFGVFAAVIIVATLLILYLNGIISF